MKCFKPRRSIVPQMALEVCHADRPEHHDLRRGDRSGWGHRLILRIVECSFPGREPGQQAFNFHSLVWEIRYGGSWVKLLKITQEDFERSYPGQWVSSLQSLEPAKGVAIFKVAEEQPTDGSGEHLAQYSWRAWDLFSNRQLQVCAEPFEPFNGEVPA